MNPHLQVIPQRVASTTLTPVSLFYPDSRAQGLTAQLFAPFCSSAYSMSGRMGYPNPTPQECFSNKKGTIYSNSVIKKQTEVQGSPFPGAHHTSMPDMSSQVACLQPHTYIISWWEIDQGADLISG